MSRISKVLKDWGYTSDGKAVQTLSFECDTISDLPTIAEMSNENIVMVLGSDAHIIQDDTKYMIKGDGVWVKQKGEFELSLDAAAIDYDNTTSGMAADNIQDAIDEIHATEAEDRAALIALVDGGAKNLLSVNGGSGTNVAILSQSGIIKSGNYVMTFKASDFSGNYALSFYDDNGALISLGSLNGAITADKVVSFKLGQDAYTVKFFIRGTATISELMLCTAADYAISPAFVPYAPTNRELYEMILQLQSAAGLRTVSTLRSAAAPLENEIEEKVTEDEER